MCMSAPHMQYEKRLFSEGHRHIVGVDEVGRGAWAGPIVAAAVILPEGPRIYGVRDSKKLSKKKREKLAARIQKRAIACSVALVTPAEIDRIGINAANELVMRHAVEQLAVRPDFILLDAFRLVGFEKKQAAIVHGDATVYSIAAASIVAKVARDNYMMRVHEQHPHFGFDTSVGYGTAKHRAALDQHGIIKDVHRCSFQPMCSMV